MLVCPKDFLELMISFSEIQFGIEDPFRVVHDSHIFLDKNPLQQKWPRNVKNDLKLVFWDLSKIKLLTVLWPCKICISWKILVHKLWTEMLSSNQIAGFFDHHYLKRNQFYMEELTKARPCLSLPKLKNAAFGWSGVDGQIRSDLKWKINWFLQKIKDSERRKDSKKEILQ